MWTIQLGFPGATNRIIPLNIISAASHWKCTVVQFYFSCLLSGIEKFALENEKPMMGKFHGIWLNDKYICFNAENKGWWGSQSPRETVFVCHQNIFRIVGDCLIYNKADA